MFGEHSASILGTHSAIGNGRGMAVEGGQNVELVFYMVDTCTIHIKYVDALYNKIMLGLKHDVYGTTTRRGVEGRVAFKNLC